MTQVSESPADAGGPDRDAAAIELAAALHSAVGSAVRGKEHVVRLSLVAMLAGLGMQGDSWSMMTPRQLYLIVRSLNRVGLSAEARMIAAEAVARG